MTMSTAATVAQQPRVAWWRRLTGNPMLLIGAALVIA